MDEADLPVKCRACEKEVKMNQVKFDDTRKAFVCNDCYAGTHSSHPVQNEPETAPVKSEEENLAELKAEMIKYTCHKCKYHFSRKKDKPEKKCPYCESENIEEMTNQASKLIEDSDNFSF